MNRTSTTPFGAASTYGLTKVIDLLQGCRILCRRRWDRRFLDRRIGSHWRARILAWNCWMRSANRLVLGLEHFHLIRRVELATCSRFLLGQARERKDQCSTWSIDAFQSQTSARKESLHVVIRRNTARCPICPRSESAPAPPAIHFLANLTRFLQLTARSTSSNGATPSATIW